MRKTLLPLALLTTVLALPGVADAQTEAQIAPGSWSQDGYGPGNTGTNPTEHIITAANVASLRYRWSLVSPVSRGSCLAQSAPVVAGGRLFLTDQGGLAAYNAVTGVRLWRKAVTVPADQETPKLAVAGSTLLAAADTCGSTSDPDGDLTAYNAMTGAQRWTVHRDAPMFRMVVDGNVVVVGGGDAGIDAVTAYRLSDGKQLWNRTGVDLAAGVSAGGRLLLSRADHSGALGVDLATGHTLWTVPAEWWVLAADPAGQRFFTADPNGRLIAVDAATGEKLWAMNGAGGMNGGVAEVAVDATRIYVSHQDDVLALYTKNGKTAWSRDLFGAVGRPVVAGNVLYVPAERQPLAILEPSTGNVLDDSSPIAGVFGHPVIVDGRLYVTDGRLLDTFGF
jgi:outer membrane protein assembly factor BamB